MKINILLLLIFLASTLIAQDARKTNIAVMPLRGSAISETDARFLTERFVIELQQIEAFDVLERDKMNEILIEQGFQQSGACDETSCLIEAGKLLPVEKIIGGSVGKIGDTYSILVRLIDIKTGRVNKSACRDYNQKMDYLLTQGMKQVAFDITGIKTKEIADELVQETPTINLDSAYAYVIKTIYQGTNKYEKLMQKRKSSSLVISKGSLHGTRKHQKYLIKRFNKEKSIIDPISKNVLKPVIDIIAEIQVTVVNDDYSECKINKAYSDILVGDKAYLKQ